MDTHTSNIRGNPLRREASADDHVRDAAAWHAQAISGDEDLREGLAALSQLATGQMELADVLGRVAEYAVLAIPGADGVGLTLTEARHADTVIASAPFVFEVEAVQLGIDEGPSITAMAEAHSVRSGSLDTDRQWPGFGSRAGQLGVHSALSIPLVTDGTVLGALNVYAHKPNAFTDHAAGVAELFAIPAAIAVQNAQVLAEAHDMATRLRTALTHRAVIDQALGILMARGAGGANDASDLLRAMTEEGHTDLHTVAGRLVEETTNGDAQPTTRAPSPRANSVIRRCARPVQLSGVDRAGTPTMYVMSAVPREVLDYYESGREFGRLTDGNLAGPLEYERTVELLQRYLPDGPSQVLDVGGGPGVYANWLARRGHAVRLVDPVGRHVDAARALGLDAELGAAHRLDQADTSLDAVLLMGPLYHLVDESDRLQALREAWRVLKPGGVLVATAISRFAALLDQLVRLDRYHEPGELDRIATIVGTGVLPARPGGVFTTAFLHLPRQLRQEVASAGFADVDVVSIEGPGYLVSNFDERWADAGRRAALVGAARLVEHDPEILALGSHLMATGRRPR